MHAEHWIAYGLYLAWLTAGFGDFLCHRRTDLPHTSGVAESATHLLQLALLGAAIVLGLAFAPGRSILCLIVVLVVAHALVGYWDTRIAFKHRRVILPIEQHIHSILDMAPWIAFGWLAADAWGVVANGDWQLRMRQPMPPVALWIAVLLPAVLLCVAPAASEFRAARAARS